MYEMGFKNGSAYGDRKDYSDKGVLNGVTHFIDGYKKWEYIKYYPDGKVAGSGLYTGSQDSVKSIGDAEQFYENGKLETKGATSNNQWVGNVKYYDENGQLISSMEMNHDKNEVYKQYYPSGAVKEDGVWDGKQWVGIYKRYFESGQVEEEFPYKNGKIDGNKKSYYQTGELEGSDSFVDNQEDGQSVTYYKSGKLKSQRMYKKGDWVGIETSYYENGQKFSELSLEDQQGKGGQIKYYDEHGKIITSPYDIAMLGLKMAEDDDERFALLDTAMVESFKVGKIDQARQLAMEIKSMLPRYTKNWNYDNAISSINIILGRIALKEGKIADAKNYLLEAGKSPGSPQMNTFGPNMSLAKELLDKGQSQVVLQYFVLCGKFWEMGKDKLKQWSDEVKAGKTPEFGINLDI